MSNYDRGIYEPSDEVRVFDGSEEEDDVEGSRLPLLIVLALLVLAMFAGVVWLAYTQGVARGRGETPVLAAAAGPERVAPPGTPGGRDLRGLAQATPRPGRGGPAPRRPAPARGGRRPPARPAGFAPPHRRYRSKPARPPRPARPLSPAVRVVPRDQFMLPTAGRRRAPATRRHGSDQSWYRIRLFDC